MATKKITQKDLDKFFDQLKSELQNYKITPYKYYINNKEVKFIYSFNIKNFLEDMLDDLKKNLIKNNKLYFKKNIIQNKMFASKSICIINYCPEVYENNIKVKFTDNDRKNIFSKINKEFLKEINTSKSLNVLLEELKKEINADRKIEYWLIQQFLLAKEINSYLFDIFFEEIQEREKSFEETYRYIISMWYEDGIIYSENNVEI